MNIKNRMASNFIIYFLCFAYIFNFKINGKTLTDSSYWVLIFCVFVFIFNLKYREICKRLFFSKYHAILLCIYAFIIIFSIISPAIQNTNDYTYISTIIHQILIIEIGFLLFSYICLKNKKKDLINILIGIFVIQASIQLISFASPEFKKITDIFRPMQAIIKAENSYTGYRGLAISGSAFFGLAVGYAIILYTVILYWKYWNCKNNIIKICLFGLLVFGALSAGRVSLFGLILGLIFFLVKVLLLIKNKNGKIIIKPKLILQFILIFIVVVLTISWGVNYIDTTDNLAVLRMYDYVNTFVQGFFSNDGLVNISSGDRLFNDMYFELTIKQIIFGDAKYTDGSSYYMQTDAGYMRPILFFGIFGLLLLFILQICFLKFLYKTNKIYAIGLLILLSVLQIKGEVIGFLIMSQSIILLMNLSCINENFKEIVNKKKVCKNDY